MKNKNKVIYEQSPWHEEHIEAIYPKLRDLLINDNSWHDFPRGGKGIAQYRIAKEGYFQAVFAKASDDLFNQLKAMSPLITSDDAEWTIWQGEDGYVITSVFTVTPGPFRNTAETAEWIYRHGLGFEPHSKGLQGVAYFSDIESGCLLDAVERLSWLEKTILGLNERLEQLSREFWADIRNASDHVVNALDNNIDQSEIIPVPNQYSTTTPKYREPA